MVCNYNASLLICSCKGTIVPLLYTPWSICHMPVTMPIIITVWYYCKVPLTFYTTKDKKKVHNKLCSVSSDNLASFSTHFALFNSLINQWSRNLRICKLCTSHSRVSLIISYFQIQLHLPKEFLALKYQKSYQYIKKAFAIIAQREGRCWQTTRITQNAK